MSKRCQPNPTPTGGEVALPVLAAAHPNRPRNSRMSKWRAAVLIAVHVIIAVHIIQWKYFSRTTLSPVEPSETMYTLNRGEVNAGFIFFSVALLLTLLLGRWICGWACHFVAYQDLCSWLLKKIGIKPKPLRSRLLLFGPLVLALYMFVWPSFYRLVAPWFGQQVQWPAWENRLLTTGFWDTFPSPMVAAVTILVAGFSIVYVLGSKGFCTYACPYGGFFAPIDRWSPARIRVTDACEHCGHCTASCTSNVRVHEEVAKFGMVVDPGCMKCLDCVSVCPNDALYFGFGKPAVGARPSAPVKRLPHSFSLAEEIALAVVALLVIWAIRGMYDVIPLLMSMGIAVMTAAVLLLAWRVLWRANEKLQNLQLKRGGRWTVWGCAVVALAGGMTVFVGHSGLVKTAAYCGHDALAKVPLDDTVWLPEGPDWNALTPAQRTSAATAEKYLRLSNDWGLAVKAAVLEDLIPLLALHGQLEEATAQARRLVRCHEDYAYGHYLLGSALAKTGDHASAIEHLKRAARHPSTRARARKALIRSYQALDQTDAMAALWLTFLDEDSAYGDGLVEGEQSLTDAAAYAATLGSELVAAGELAAAETCFRKAQAIEPSNDAARVGLRLVLQEQGRIDEALTLFARMVGEQPKDARLWMEYAELLFAAGQYDKAAAAAAEASRLDATLLQAVKVRAFALAAVGRGADGANAWQAAVQAQPDNPDVLVAYGQFLLEFQHWEEAAAAGEQAIALAPNEAAGYLLLADARLGAGQSGDAMKPLRQGIALAPDVAEPYYSLAVACLLVRDYPGGLEAIQKATELSPRDPEYLRIHAMLLKASGDPQAARKVETLRETLLSEPGSSSP